MINLLVVDDEVHVRKALKTVLEKEGYRVDEAENGRAALERFGDSSPYSLVLLDLNMPEMKGMELLKEVRERFPEIHVIIITAYSTAETTMEAMSLGAYDYIVKPFDITQIKQIVRKAVDANQLSAEVRQLRQTMADHYTDRMVGKSLAMQEIYKMVGRVAASPVTVLIQGESGTGKELIAKQIHFNSPRASFPLVTVNCGAIPENLLESELFGYEKGAFTGAQERKNGKMELADQGTVFLDEIGELSLSLQVKLLRFLQEQEIERVGGTQPIKVNVRVIAATNRNLQAMVKEGTFREDLFYRLNVVNLHLPSLRNRKEDLSELAAHFLVRFSNQMGNQVKYISPEAMEKLLQYDWPGNIRQLQNVICRAVVMARGDILFPEDLPEWHTREPIPSTKDRTSAFVLQEEFSNGFTMREVLRKAEMEAMKWALQQTEGNKAQAARLLDMSRKAFVYKCQEYELNSDS